MTDETTPLPSDEPTAEEVAVAATVRPLEQLPSPWEVTGNPRILSEPTLEALSPADREAVLQRAGSDKPEAISGALKAFLHERSVEVRIRAGAGDGATESEREALSQMNQLRLLSGEVDRLKAELAEVREHRTEHDANGNPVPVPVYALQGDGRTARQNRLNEIMHEMSLVAGLEGEAAMKRAARADALKARELKQQVEDSREIKRRAHEMAREDRINQAARNRARFL